MHTLIRYDAELNRPPHANGAPANGAPTPRRPENECLNLEVLILYGEAEAAQQAVSLVSTLARRFSLADEVRPVMRFWRFDLLAQRLWQSCAQADFDHSQMLIVATNRRTGPPHEVACWLKSCLHTRPASPAALVALLGPAASLDGPDSPRRRFLERAAVSGGLDFFAPEPRACTATWGSPCGRGDGEGT